VFHEPSQGGVAEARTRFGHVTFINDVFPSVALRGRRFDIVVCSEVIEHVEDQRSFVWGLAHVTRPDGALVLTTPNGKWWRQFSKQYARSLQPIENWLTWPDLKRLLCGERFVIAQHLQWYPGWTSTGIHRAQNSPKLNGLLTHLKCGWMLRLSARLLNLGLYQGVLATWPGEP
jgi:SAM-dependent methyltransferase